MPERSSFALIREEGRIKSHRSAIEIVLSRIGKSKSALRRRIYGTGSSYDRHRAPIATCASRDNDERADISRLVSFAALTCIPAQSGPGTPKTRLDLDIRARSSDTTFPPFVRHDYAIMANPQWAFLNSREKWVVTLPRAIYLYVSRMSIELLARILIYTKVYSPARK